VESMKKLGHQPGLDGVRGIAIALVVSYHAFGWPRGGYFGVDLFFVLSGFLITTLLLEEHAMTGCISLRAFYERRARRLLPALFMLLAVYAAVESAVGGHPWAPVLEGLFYSTNFVVAFGGPHTPISQLWSLGAEEQFYVLWPLVMILLLRRRPNLLAPLIFCSLAAASAEGIWLTASGASLPRVTYGPDTRSVGLLAGCLFAVSRNRIPVKVLRRRSALIVVTAAPLATLAIAFLDPGAPLRELVLPLLALWFAGLVYEATDNGLVARLLAQRPLAFMGGISYSLYLWHPLVITFFGTHPSFVIGVAAVAVSLVIAALSTRYVERPFRRSRIRDARPVVPAPVVVAVEQA
jgi:peptidoglycan/LPS O-acetylase OafA/YrhL